MDKVEIKFEDFLNDVDPEYHEFTNQMNNFLINNGCKIKIENAKSGYVVSYTHTKTKRVIINFVFRKNGLVIRIYGDNVSRYNDFIDSMPEKMIKAVEKAPSCKRLIDITKCNSRCPMGYEFTIGDKTHKKCRYSSFMFDVNNESIPFITAFVENEIKERTA